MTIGFPFLSFRSYFCFPFGLCGVCNQCGQLSQSWACGFSALSDLRIFLTQHFLLFRVIMGQERAGHEQADVCRAASGGGSAHPQPGARQVLGMIHGTFLYLAFN